MIKTQLTKSMTEILKAIPRYFVGLILISTGIGKGLDMDGFVTVLDEYQLQPHWLSIVLAYSLPFIEFGIGLGLLIAKKRVILSWLAIGIHILMLTVVVYTLNRGIAVSNCGCFGVFLARPLTFITAIEDSVMLTLSFLVLLEARLKAKETARSLSIRGINR